MRKIYQALGFDMTGLFAITHPPYTVFSAKLTDKPHKPFLVDDDCWWEANICNILVIDYHIWYRYAKISHKSVSAEGKTNVTCAQC